MKYPQVLRTIPNAVVVYLPSGQVDMPNPVAIELIQSVVIAVNGGAKSAQEVIERWETENRPKGEGLGVKVEASGHFIPPAEEAAPPKRGTRKATS